MYKSEKRETPFWATQEAFELQRELKRRKAAYRAIREKKERDLWTERTTRAQEQAAKERDEKIEKDL